MEKTNINLDELQRRIVLFRDERDWKQFHNPKDVALSLVLEAAEVMEHFQWKSSSEIDEYVRSHRDDIAEELADTLYWVLLLANDLEIDVLEASTKKLDKNAAKYPTAKAKGRNTKYNKL